MEDPRQRLCEQRLTDPGGADHDDVLGGDLVAEFLGNLLSTPPVPQGDGNRSLRFALSDDVTVELGDNLSRCETSEHAHGKVTTETLSLV